MKRSKCLKMCYTSRYVIMSRRGEGGGITRSICVAGGRFLSCTGGIFSKSAEVGGKHGAVQCKAAAGFVPVHRCRSPHIRLIQSHRHQMPWKCQTQSLKRQQATEEEAQTASSTTTEDIYTLGEKKKINFCVEMQMVLSRLKRWVRHKKIPLVSYVHKNN